MTIEWLDKHISNSVKPFVIELCVWKTWEIVLNDCWKLYNQYRLLESTTNALRHMTYGPQVVNRKFIKTPCLQRGNVGKEPAGTSSLYNKHCCYIITHILLRRQIYSLVFKDKDKDKDLLTHRNLLWDILRLPSSHRAALGLYVILILWRARGTNQPPYVFLHRSSSRHALCHGRRFKD